MNKQFFRNASWFGLIQIANFILPFVAIPYLTRVLLPEAYGTVAFALAIATFLTLICDYGFNWSAMRSVSARRDDADRLRRLFSDVMSAKAVIFGLVALVYGMLILAVPTLRRDGDVYALAFVATLGTTCFPYWFLQGIEEVATLAALTLGARIAGIATILALVHTPDDADTAALLMALPNLLAGLGGMAIVRRRLGRIVSPTLAGIVEQFRDGWSTFVGTVTIGAYTSGQAVMVGALGGPVLAGYFVSADRCMAAGKSLLSIVTQSALPRVAYLAEHAPAEGVRFVRRLLWFVPVTLCASLAMLFIPDPIIRLLFGQPFVVPVAPLFRILSPVPVLLSMSSCFASLYMFNFGYRKLWSRMLVMASGISLATTLILYLFFPADIAAATGATMAEVFVVLLSGRVFWRATRPA